MVDGKDKGNSNSNSKTTPSSKPVPFEKRGSKSVPPASYDPTVKVPKQPKRK